MAGVSSQLGTERLTRDAIDRHGRAIRQLEAGDVRIEASRRLVVRSPNGHYWSVMVDNTGALATVDLGTSL